MDSKLIARCELAKCLIQLAQRAGEIDELNIKAVLLTLVAAIGGDSDDELAELCSEYAKEVLEDMDIDPTEMDENDE